MTVTHIPTWRESAMTEPQLRVRLRSLPALHNAMEYRGFTSGYALAKAAGLTPGVVNHLVHGHRKTCSGKTARAIAEALQMPQDTLFVAELFTVRADRARKAAA